MAHESHQDAKNIQAKKPQEPPVVATPESELEVASPAFDAATSAGTIDAQAAALNRMPSAQGQAMVARMNRVQGNQHVQRVVASLQRSNAVPTVQPKLTVGAADDQYEQEADQVADSIMKMPAPATPPGDGGDEGNVVQPKLQTRRAQPSGGGGEAFEASSDVESRIEGMRGGGRPLPETERNFFEPRMGVDLSSVRVHTDDTAKQTSQDIQARAYTVGSDIAFNSGEYQPGTTEGRRLLGHELTHVVQQGGAHRKVEKIERKALTIEQAITKAKETFTGADAEAEQEAPIPQEERALPEVEIPDKGGSSGAAGSVAAPKEEAADEDKEAEKQAQEGAEAVGEETTASEGQPDEAAAPPAEAPGAESAPPAPAPTSQAEGGASASEGAQEAAAATPAAPVQDAPKSGGGGGSGKDSAASEGAAAPQAGSGDKAPASPEEDPGFQAVAGRSEGVAEQEQTHDPAESKSGEAQAAADPQGTDVEMAAQDRQVGEIEQEEPQEFNPQAFMDKLLEKITQAAPNNLKEAENFDGNKLNEAKGAVSNQVTKEKQAAEDPIEKKAEEEPNTSGIDPKQVEDVPPADPGAHPGSMGAEQAAPKPKGVSEVEAPIQEESQSLDEQMAEADVTEEQLEKSNEPEFHAALDAKSEAQTHTEESPQDYRGTEAATLDAAQSESAATADQSTDQMHDERAQLMEEVFGFQGEAKTEDEAERQRIANEIADIYEETKTEVTGIFSELDTWVETKFEEGANAAKDNFVKEAKRRVRDFKIDRYLCRPDGLILWAQDQFRDPPAEVEAIFQDERNNYIKAVEAVLWEIAQHITAELNRAKVCVAQGRQNIQDYVSKLAPELQEIGQQAAQDIQGKFDELEQSISDKQDSLIDDLTDQYSAKLQEVDEEIEKLREANKGLVKKAGDAIKGAIDTIIELKNLLMDTLSRALDAVDLIIKDPITFLGNLLEGIKMGFMQFVGNIGKHLQSALVGWLTGTLGPAGITLPETWDLKGIFSLVLQVLGLTWQNIRAQIVEGLGPNGEQIMGALETGWEVIQIIMTDGLAGLWQYIQDKVGDLKTMVLEQIKSMVIEQVIKTGVEWLVSMLGGPAGAFVKAVQSIVRVVTWFVDNAGRIASLVNSIIDSVTNIASGNLAGAANFIEDSLAQALPTVIGFMADLLGLGGLAKKVQDIIAKIRAPINKGIQWLVKQAKAMAKKVGKFMGLGKEDEGKDPNAEPDEKGAVTAAEGMLKSKDATPESVRGQLPGLKDKFNLTTIPTLKAGSGDKYYVQLARTDEIDLEGDDAKIVNLSSFGKRPGFSSSVKSEVPIGAGEDRRHIVAYDALEQDLLFKVNGKTVKEAAEILTKLKHSPQSLTPEGIKEAGRAYLIANNNDKDNLWPGERSENRSKGSNARWSKEKMAQAITNGDKTRCLAELQNLRDAWLDPNPESPLDVKYQGTLNSVINQYKKEFEDKHGISL